MSDIREHFRAIHARIDRAMQTGEHAADHVELIAVSKGQPLEKLTEALRLGQRALGESYVQEWQDKADALTEHPVEWHFVGGLQSNKIRYLVDRVRVIHGVDRKKLVNEIRKRATKPQRILLQVNISGEEAKSGCDPAEALDLVKHALDAEIVTPIGLMTIPENVDDPELVRPQFAELRALRDRIRDELSADYDMSEFRHLSMGMSDDFEIAIEEGATLVRVGTAIFGSRDYS